MNVVSGYNVGVGVRALCYGLGKENTGIGYDSQCGSNSSSILAVQNTSVGCES